MPVRSWDRILHPTACTRFRIMSTVRDVCIYLTACTVLGQKLGLSTFDVEACTLDVICHTLS